MAAEAQKGRTHGKKTPLTENRIKLNLQFSLSPNMCVYSGCTCYSTPTEPLFQTQAMLETKGNHFQSMFYIRHWILFYFHIFCVARSLVVVDAHTTENHDKWIYVCDAMETFFHSLSVKCLCFRAFFLSSVSPTLKFYLRKLFSLWLVRHSPARAQHKRKNRNFHFGKSKTYGGFPFNHNSH